MLYPLAYWHTHLPRNFDWFVSGDFIPGLPMGSDRMMLGVFLLSLLAYTAKELVALQRTGTLNLPKQLVIWGTALS
jgi:hypothetical protein